MRCHGAEQAPALAVRHDGAQLDVDYSNWKSRWAATQPAAAALKLACSGVSKSLTDSMRRTALDLGLTYRALADGGCTRQSCNEDIPRRWISTA
jgi:hypothetical protein